MSKKLDIFITGVLLMALLLVGIVCQYVSTKQGCNNHVCTRVQRP